ncbi:BTB/POZ and MATH domain-containing protein [Trifolium repens]|jgi:speckle-type POZ protein|nr:BTB/POZ and MATH domain-containing protein [Trifolium repens]
MPFRIIEFEFSTSEYSLMDIMLCAAVMQSQAFLHLKESCPSMLLELLETFASVDDNSSQTLSRKRSGSSIYGQDLADGGAAESINPNGRRVRRRS